jgi:hypothetical protein
MLYSYSIDVVIQIFAQAHLNARISFKRATSMVMMLLEVLCIGKINKGHQVIPI